MTVIKTFLKTSKNSALALLFIITISYVIHIAFLTGYNYYCIDNSISGYFSGIFYGANPWCMTLYKISSKSYNIYTYNYYYIINSLHTFVEL